MLLPNSGVYQQRHVLFCDILGFSAAVLNGTVPATRILMLLQHLRAVEQEANRRIDPEEPEPDTGLPPDYVVQSQATYFSDCITISVPATQPDAIWLCQTAAEMQKLMVRAGFLCRGAICTGELYHDDQLLFGPAYIRAVIQEKETWFPRISVDLATVDHFLTAPESEEEREIMRAREYQLLIRDGETFHIDPFHWLKFFANSPNPPPHPHVPPEVEAWRRVITRGLGIADPRTRAKYIWAANEFNARMAPPGSWVQPIEVATTE